MAILLPGWMAKLFNLMGLAGGAGWTNANEDTAHAVGGVYRTHANNIQPTAMDAKTHGQRATAAVQGDAGTAMTAAVDHPQGPVSNLLDHHRGALVTSLIAGAAVPVGLGVYKMAKLIDGGVTAAELASSALVPGGELAWPEELAVGRLTQNAITNTAADFLMGA
jgi:hypothetical protein